MDLPIMRHEPAIVAHTFSLGRTAFEFATRKRGNEAMGGIGQTPLQPVVRIDYVEHTASAMARGLDLVPER